ncbi:MAG TPA: alpha/beta hydrolase [Gaiella sp.]|jgi:acetyl esterase/lipase
MTRDATPLGPPARPGLVGRIVLWCLSAAVRVSLLFGPRPAALLVRKLFAAGGRRTAAGLARHAPKGVESILDERYGEDVDTVLDLYRPASPSGPLPLVLWIHGGGFVGGARHELADYLRLVASHGYAVAAPSYSLAPEHRYPTPPRQMMQALAYLQANAGRLGIEPERIALAGDSAGAHIAAQLGALVTTPGYAEAIGIPPTVTAAQLRCVALACGPFDVALVDRASPTGRRFIEVVLWAYTGVRGFRDDPRAAAWSITENVTSSFPPTLLTVGNADPLRPHSELLAERLRTAGAEVETLFFPDDHQPPLGHEYQFDLDGAAGRLFLERLHAFLEERLARD